MARGIINAIIGARWARRFLWMFMVWVALNITLLRTILDIKWFGIDHIFAWAYGIIMLIIAWDVYHSAI